MGKLHGTQKWRKRAAYQLSIEPLCRMCSAIGRITAATCADHIIPHRDDPHLFWSGELQSLCTAHHSGTKQQQETSGYSTEVGADGTPIDPSHPWNH